MSKRKKTDNAMTKRKKTECYDQKKKDKTML